MKRIVLFVATNIAIMIMISIVVGVFGFDRYLTRNGIDYPTLMVFSLVWGFGGAIVSLLMSRWMAKSAMGVRVVNGSTGNGELDWLHQTVSSLARKAELPMPEVGIYDSPEVNAFATGPSKRSSLVAVSSGLMRSMRREEIEGVLAHEMSHIKNGDMVTMTLIQGVVNAFSIFLSRVLAGVFRRGDDRDSGSPVMMTFMLQMVFSFLGMFIVAWFSRAREFRADAGAAVLSSRENMVAALQRLAANKALVDTSQPQLATMKINGARGYMALLSTHPPLEERIAALQRPTLR
ncbi:MAG TPA: protease HtpX [Vicinamibacterales bacterium]|nr:protease HtpX [Vicinamibacterales bacterium]